MQAIVDELPETLRVPGVVVGVSNGQTSWLGAAGTDDVSAGRIGSSTGSSTQSPRVSPDAVRTHLSWFVTPLLASPSTPSDEPPVFVALASTFKDDINTDDLPGEGEAGVILERLTE